VAEDVSEGDLLNFRQFLEGESNLSLPVFVEESVGASQTSKLGGDDGSVSRTDGLQRQRVES